MKALVEFFGGPLDGKMEFMPLSLLLCEHCGKTVVVAITRHSDPCKYWYRIHKRGTVWTGQFDRQEVKNAPPKD